MIFQGCRQLRDEVISGNAYVGQEDAFTPKLLLSVAKKTLETLKQRHVYHWGSIGKEKLWKAAL